MSFLGTPAALSGGHSQRSDPRPTRFSRSSAMTQGANPETQRPWRPSGRAIDPADSCRSAFFPTGLHGLLARQCRVPSGWMHWLASLCVPDSGHRAFCSYSWTCQSDRYLSHPMHVAQPKEMPLLSLIRLWSLSRLCSPANGSRGGRAVLGAQALAPGVET